MTSVGTPGHGYFELTASTPLEPKGSDSHFESRGNVCEKPSSSRSKLQTTTLKRSPPSFTSFRNSSSLGLNGLHPGHQLAVKKIPISLHRPSACVLETSDRSPLSSFSPKMSARPSGPSSP